MRVIVVGCGRMGADLAYRLFKRGHDVAVIDIDETAFNALPPDFQGRFYEGDAMAQEVLHRSGIEACDVVVVTTSSDAENLVIGHAVRAHYHVPNVIARNYEPHNRSLYEAFNLQCINATSWAAQRLEEMVYHTEIRTVFSAGNGEVEIYEVTIPESWNGQPIEKLISCQDCVLVSLTRSGTAFLPSSDTVLQAGDLLHFSATLDGTEALWAKISRPPEED
ncbi:MAG TPA: TrkA family potassium uptake protein [Anaerolineaceae bacterium]|nr:TrkA family potassium uptake protein [Anaerolineaceae bacterium]